MNLEELGFTKEELQERAIQKIAEDVMSGFGCDEDGAVYKTDSSFSRRLQAHVAKQIDATIDALAQKHVLPNVHQYIESLVLQETNQWGEAKGQKVTFIEYLVKRAEEYMLEKVDFDGKTKAESGGYSWSGKQTRITHLIHRHLHSNIETAMKNALLIANNSIAKGIEETVRTQLVLLSDRLKVEVKAK